MQIGQTVTFDQGDDQHTQLTGTISRVWSCGDVTVKVPGAVAGTVKTYVRQASQVRAV